jgi:sugar lactone lactonase YvrE
MHLADLNGDGDLDLVVASDETLANRDWMYLRPHPRMTYSFFDNQDARGDFARVDNTLEDRGSLTLVGDINGDGAAELVESPREIAGVIIHQNITPTEVVPGDINQDGSLDVVDVDQFCLALFSGEVDSRLDVSGDQQVTLADFEYLVEQLAHLKYGDANLDGDFDSSDLLRVLQRGHYEDGVPANSGWRDGDWNCDREFSTADLVVTLQHGNYGQVVQDSFLLVAHRETDQVLSFDAATGEFVAEFAKLERPLDIEVGPDGDVYVAQQTGPPRLSRYRANGQLVTSIVIPGRADAPRLAFGPNGDLYAAYFLSRRIERFSVDGDEIVSLGDIVQPGVLGSVNGFDVGPNGDLYVAVGQTETIWRFSGTTGERLDDFAAAPGPEGMAFGPDGDLYVGSDLLDGGQVRRYDGTSGKLASVLIDELPHAYGHIDPVFSDDGYLLLAIVDHEGYPKVHRYDALTGEWIDVLAGEGEVGLEFPVDIALLKM